MGELRGYAKGGRVAEKRQGFLLPSSAALIGGFLLERAGGVKQPVRAILGWLWFPRAGFLHLEKNEQEKQNNWSQEYMCFIPAFWLLWVAPLECEVDVGTIRIKKEIPLFSQLEAAVCCLFVCFNLLLGLLQLLPPFSFLRCRLGLQLIKWELALMTDPSALTPTSHSHNFSIIIWMTV